MCVWKKAVKAVDALKAIEAEENRIALNPASLLLQLT